jgi:hypothetical protein
MGRLFSQARLSEWSLMMLGTAPGLPTLPQQSDLPASKSAFDLSRSGAGGRAGLPAPTMNRRE